MFFGGGGMGGGPFAEAPFADFGVGGGGFTFGGPGIRVRQFGTGPGMRQRQQQQQQRRREPEDLHETAATNLWRMFYQMLPLILLFLFPVLSGLFGGGGPDTTGPTFSMHPSPPYTQQRVTPTYNIPFYVNPKDLEGMGMREATKLGNRAEQSIINHYNSGCAREEMARQQKLQDAHGFFYTDKEALKRAREMEMPSCRKLQELGLPRKRVY
jgi:DnaJ family protein B protein 12